MNKRNNINKVICIGWHKTGTSTIGMALKELGYNVVGARLDTTDALNNDNMESVMKLADKFDALADVPWAALYKELDKKFPDSKFILTIRDEDNWLNSASKHFGDTYVPMHEWLYGKGILKGNEKLYLEKYRQHNKDVVKYFRDRFDDLLVMDFEGGDGWEKLCPFLEHPTPRKRFPHANKGKHSYNRKDKLINGLRSITPDIIIKAAFQVKLFILKRMDKEDPRNRFNNFPQNRNERMKNRQKIEYKCRRNID